MVNVIKASQSTNSVSLAEKSNKEEQKFPSDMMSEMKSAALDASQLLKSLSHPDRLMLLCQMTQGEYCVSELEELVGIGQPSLSQQLGILRKEELVATRREGKQIYYRINSDDVLAILTLMYERFCPK